MCTSKPKMPSNTKETPAVLQTVRDGSTFASGAGDSQGRRKLRIDLNNASSTQYGSSLVIPT